MEDLVSPVYVYHGESHKCVYRLTWSQLREVVTNKRHLERMIARAEAHFHPPVHLFLPNKKYACQYCSRITQQKPTQEEELDWYDEQTVEEWYKAITPPWKPDFAEGVRDPQYQTELKRWRNRDKTLEARFYSEFLYKDMFDQAFPRGLPLQQESKTKTEVVSKDQIVSWPNFPDDDWLRLSMKDLLQPSAIYWETMSFVNPLYFQSYLNNMHFLIGHRVVAPKQLQKHFERSNQTLQDYCNTHDMLPEMIVACLAWEWFFSISRRMSFPCDFDFF